MNRTKVKKKSLHKSQIIIDQSLFFFIIFFFFISFLRYPVLELPLLGDDLSSFLFPFLKSHEICIE